MHRTSSFFLSCLVVLGMLLGTAAHAAATDETVVQSSPPPPVAAAPAPPGAVSSREDDPGARRDFEELRLADPSTGRIPVDIQRLEREFAAGLPRWDGRGGIDAAVRDAARAEGRAKVSGWTYRGPNNVGGRTRALALDVTDPTYRTLLAGGISGGMWRTTDEGASWNLTTGSSQLHSVTALAQDVRTGHESTWYYGTGEVRGNSAGATGAPFRGDGVFKSTDGGLSWSVLPSTSSGTPQTFDTFDYVWRVAVDPSNLAQEEVYAATYGGIQRSVDGGNTWTWVLGDTLNLSRYVDLVVSPSGMVYASLSSEGTVNGVFRSPDGVNWTKISPYSTPFSRTVLAIAPSNEDLVYVLVADLGTSGFHGFYLYDDATGFWDDRSANIQSLPDQGGPGGDPFVSYTGYCQTVAVHPTNPNIVTLGGLHLVRSTDGFTTTNNLTWMGGWTYDNHHADVHVMFYRPGSGSIAYTGSDGGVHKTDDANAGTVVWDSFNDGYRTSQFYTVALDHGTPGSDIVIGGMQDNGTWWTGTPAAAADWTELLGGDGSYCAIADASGPTGTYYLSVQNGVVYRFTVDALGNWVDWTRIDPTGGSGYLFINPFLLDPDDTRRVYLATANGVWRNSNAEAIPLFSNNTTSLNWTHLTTTPTGVAIGSLAVATDGSGTLYYGANDGHVYAVPSAAAAPASTVPTNLTVGKGLPSAYVSDIAIDPNDASRMLISYSNYNVQNLWSTSDGGTTWRSEEGNLGGTNSPSVRSVAILPLDNGTRLYLAATSVGLYSTNELDGATTVWQLESADLIGNTVVDMLKVRPDDGLIVAGTHGKGVYSVVVDTAVPAPVAPQGAYLGQNAPNPFNPNTSIAFRTEADGPVRLTVFDVAGRRVRHLVDRTLPAGHHVVEWNGRDDQGHGVATGTYVYTLESDGASTSRKMTLVK